MLSQPDESQPPAPAYHKDTFNYPPLCHYGFISTDKNGKAFWVECDCEDPEKPWPPRLETDGPRNCSCYHCIGKMQVDRGRAPCEYTDHHCETCHDNKICTTVVCVKERDFWSWG